MRQPEQYKHSQKSCFRIRKWGILENSARNITAERIRVENMFIKGVGDWRMVGDKKKRVERERERVNLVFGNPIPRERVVCSFVMSMPQCECNIVL